MLQRYSLGAIILHWLLALALAFQLSLGLGLDYLGPRGFAVYQLHKSIGITILLLSLLRLVWRWTHKRPPPLEGGFSGSLAKTVHFGLYLFMIGGPLTGWLLVSTDKLKVPTLLFGKVPWPHLAAPDKMNAFAHASHALLGFLGIALILLHVAGAIRHQWLIRDNLMARMAPPRGLWVMLALLVPVGWAMGVMAIKSAGMPPTAAMPPAEAERATEKPAPQPSIAAPLPETVKAAESAAETAAPPPVWTIAPGGTLAFSVSNGTDRISGRFRTWRGDIAFDPDRPESAAITLNIDLRSASLGDATQDEMLAGADFLDIVAFPMALYRATSVSRLGTDRYRARGTLTLKGQSRPQDLVFSLKGKGLSRHVEGSATIDRTGFGVGTGEAAQNLARNVDLTFSFDARGRVAE